MTKNRQKQIEETLLACFFIVLAFMCGYFCSNIRCLVTEADLFKECLSSNLKCNESCIIKDIEIQYLNNKATYNFTLTKQCK